MLSQTELVQKSIGRLRKFLKKNPKSPAPEKLHQIRTSVRRLESSLAAMNIGKKRLKKRLERNLPVLRKRLGKVRDMDVLTAHAISIASKASERECLVQLLEHLGAKRSEYTKRLRKAAKNYGPRLRNDLAKIVEKMEDAANQPGEKGSGENGALEFGGQQVLPLRELISGLDRPKRLNKSSLHSYRLKIKELRYILQLSKKIRSQELVKKLGEVKDAIGEWHDWEDLRAITAEVVNGGPQSKLARQLKKITHQKFNNALSTTNHMRKTHGNAKPHRLLDTSLAAVGE